MSSSIENEKVGTITLLKPYKNTNYQIIMYQHLGPTGNYANGSATKNKKVQNFQYTNNSGGKTRFSWETKGQI